MTTNAETIAAIVKAARRECPKIVERRMLWGTDGELHLPNGFPAGVEWAGRLGPPYYVYFNCIHGFTYGARADTRQALEATFAAYADRDSAKFEAELQSMSAEHLASQAKYWLKDTV